MPGSTVDPLSGNKTPKKPASPPQDTPSSCSPACLFLTVFVHDHAHPCLVRPRLPHAYRSIHRAGMKAKVRFLFPEVLNDLGPGRLKRASPDLALLALQFLVPPEPKGHQAPGHSRGL